MLRTDIQADRLTDGRSAFLQSPSPLRGGGLKHH